MNALPPDDSDYNLEAQLRVQPGTPLPDDGFSRRVLRALPGKRPERSRRIWLCSAALAAACAAGFAQWGRPSLPPMERWLEALGDNRTWEPLLRPDSPLWITALSLGATYALLKFLEVRTGGRRT